jgi:hypothetical protein
LQGLENDDVRELLNSRSEGLTDDLLLDEQRAHEEADNDNEEQDNVQVKEFTVKKFEDIIRALEINLNYIIFFFHYNISLLNI